MSYNPHTEHDRERMLTTVGLADVADLFTVVPEAIRFPELRLPTALSELEASQTLAGLAAENADAGRYAMFLGAGAYKHYVPEVVNHLVSWGEF